NEVARVEIEAEGRTVVQGFQRLFAGIDVISNLAGMRFEREFNADAVVDIQHRVPAVCKFAVSSVDHRVGGRRKAINQVPIRAAGEAVDDFHAELRGGAAGVGQFVSGTA